MEERGKRQRSKEERLMFLKVAEEHGITEACQRLGIPRTTCYYWKTKLEQGGEEPKQLWECVTVAQFNKAIDNWCEMAYQST